jgi:hypothetical protein
MDLKTLKGLHDRHGRYLPAVFFVLGFIFDIFTLNQIDDPISIIQQAIYLVIVSRLLYFRTLETAALWSAPPRLAKIWIYQNEILHFFLGSLLSSYTLFYFVSASFSTSLIFMILMFGLLIANELPALQSRSLSLKSGLYYLCLFSFLSFVTPIILRSVSALTLALALALGLFVSWSARNALVKKTVDKTLADRVQLLPASAVAMSILVLYFLKLLPPLPVSVQYIGVYHKVEKQGEHYALSYDRPLWKFWQNGAQSFVAQPGDRIHVFARVFSPATMDDQVTFRWEFFERDKWNTTDVVKMRVFGGRSEGFRAFASKANYQAGEWRVKIETMDGREMARIYFDLELSDPSTREFRVDLQ